jgi:3-demethoxyubiquinol 3-hydroxylase
VDLAGELAAKHIYQSQLAVHRGTASSRAQLQVMLAHELEHLRYFEESLPGARARPSLLNPLWQGLASALGTVSGLAGEKAAFLTTAAVEEVIVEHYTR